MPIRVLDAFTAGQIAAGEVVERPASVIKELVENAVDAGATEIRVEIRAGGTREMRITDNGSGIPADEVEVAFQRHATSKLQTAADLFNVQTLGFRGEALPSIATVAQVTCRTRTADAATGVEVRLADGRVQGRTPWGGPPGTTFLIQNLFHNAPVRLKFLRPPASEAAHISAVVSNYALAYPQIRWQLVVDGRAALQTPGTGRLLDVLIEFYGVDVARQLIPVTDAAGAGEQAMQVEGFVSRPTVHRSARSSIHLFVNRRWVQPRGPLVAVLEEAYHTLLMKGRHPLAVLHLTVDPEVVDVNVHPTKSEVKFLYESQVLGLLGRAVRTALSEYADAPPLQLASRRSAGGAEQEASEMAEAPDETPAAPPMNEAIVMAPVAAPPERIEPGAVAPRTAPHSSPHLVPESATPEPVASRVQHELPTAGVTAADPRVAEARPQPHASPPSAATRRPAPVSPPVEQPRLGMGERRAEPGESRPMLSLQALGQSGGTYIVATSPEGVHLIDQHAAHERVVYERLQQRESAEPLEQQTLLLPAQITLPPELRTVLSAQRDALTAWGFTVEHVADADLKVIAVPAGLQEGEVVATLAELGEQLLAGGDAPPAARHDTLLATIACHSAIRAGQTLSHDEMQQLVDQLEQCAQPRTCPHGRPTMLTLSHRQLERQFGRKG